MTLLDQRDFRDRLYQELPIEWFPDPDDAPVLSGVMDMMAATWSSNQVVQRTVQFDVNSNIILLDGIFAIPVGSLVTGPEITGNPIVTRTYTETIAGITYQTVQVRALQVLPAGTRLLFHVPDAENDGLAEFLSYMQNESRLQTSSSLWLDLFAQDFFGPNLQRHIGETDVSYRHRIGINVIAPRITRCSVDCGLTNLTGYAPTIIEVRNTGDCGSYTGITNPVWGGLAYNEAGAYGSMELPFQFFVRATRPLGEGIPNVSGYSSSTMGYATCPLPFGYIGPQRVGNFGTGEYVQLADLENNMAVTDTDIYKTIADSVAAGVTAWTSISTDIQSEIRSTGLLGISFYLNLTCLAAASGNPGEIRISGALKLASDVVIIEQGSHMSAVIRIVAVAVLDNPNFASVATIPLSMAARISIDAHLAEAASIVTFGAVAQMLSKNPITTASKLALANVTYVTLDNPITTISNLSIVATADVTHTTTVSIGKISAAITAETGALTVDFLSMNFVVGSSLLIPAGGHLGKTLLLGTSQIGVDYGY